MAKCPNKRKSSVSAASNGQQRIFKQRNWASLAGLAKLHGCSQRTMREWCKKGLIQEADQTRGGHWRIRMPLGWKTLVFLAKRQGEWPITGKNVVKTLGKDWMRVFEADRAEWYALAFIYQCALNEDIPVPYIAEFPDFPELAANPADRKAQIARRFQDEIMQMNVARAKGNKVEPSKFFLKLLLLGSVYQFWREKQRRPRVSEIAEFMGLSRADFFRRYTSEELNLAYRDASERFGVQLPDPDGLDPVLKQNIKAKKRGFESLHHDPFADKDDTFGHLR